MSFPNNGMTVSIFADVMFRTTFALMKRIADRKLLVTSDALFFLFVSGSPELLIILEAIKFESD